MLLLIRLLLVGVCLAGMSPAAEPRRTWDGRLLELPIGVVHIAENSLPQAWQALNTAHSIRGVLFIDEEVDSNGPCAIELTNATIAQAFAALLARYPGYTLTQDVDSGVLWIHPRRWPIERLFAQMLDFVHDEPALPFGSALLKRLLEEPGLGLELQQSGISAKNSIEWPVDIPKGRWSLRSVWNRALANAPTRSLYFHRPTTGAIVLEVISTLGEQSDQPRIGAIAWWEQAFSAPAPTGPEWNGLTAALADPTPNNRAIARGYLAINILNSIRTTPWHDIPVSQPTVGVWANVALAKVLARLPGSSYREVRDCLRTLFDQGGFAKLPPELALVAACELTRLAKDDASPLDAVAKRTDLAGADFTLVADDLYRLARLSPAVRSGLERHRLATSLFPEGTTRLGEALMLTVTRAPDLQPVAITQDTDKNPDLWQILRWAAVVAIALVLIVIWSTRKD